MADIEGKTGEIYDQEIADLGTSASLNYANLLTLHQWAFEENKQVRLKNGFSHYLNITLTKNIFANEITTIILYNYLIFFIKEKRPSIHIPYMIGGFFSFCDLCVSSEYTSRKRLLTE